MTPVTNRFSKKKEHRGKKKTIFTENEDIEITLKLKVLRQWEWRHWDWREWRHWYYIEVT